MFNLVNKNFDRELMYNPPQVDRVSAQIKATDFTDNTDFNISQFLQSVAKT